MADVDPKDGVHLTPAGHAAWGRHGEAVRGLL